MMHAAIRFCRNRLVTVIINEPEFSYTEYPLDSQWINFRMTSFTYSQYLCTLSIPPETNGKQNYLEYTHGSSTGDADFDLNPVWTHYSNDPSYKRVNQYEVS